ncbi:MAG: hypothetical protein CMC81_07015 [Flavobacteriaceae bacterium]|nr:hypothetical protein [Flavobacteriaceae bacterium]|tara:strand:+ start:2255 stop:2779 length:525 start_codon:yes stop_codon:yes gene_type:complete
MSNNFFVFLLGLTLIISCQDNLIRYKQKETIFYLIRHAEKDRSNPENKDPSLTNKGIKRANNWASYFDTITLNSIYTTDYLRTKQTVFPVSKLKKITPKIYSPDELDINKFININQGKRVLISGHSDTTPSIVNKLIGETKFSNMLDSDNNSLYIVNILKSEVSVEVRSVTIGN